jgi:hypothetical protein
MRFDNSFFMQVAFISQQQLVDRGGRVSVYFAHPLFYIIEGRSIGNVIHDNNSVCSSIVARCNCSESFLSCKSWNVYYWLSLILPAVSHIWSFRELVFAVIINPVYLYCFPIYDQCLYFLYWNLAEK